MLIIDATLDPQETSYFFKQMFVSVQWGRQSASEGLCHHTVSSNERVLQTIIMMILFCIIMIIIIIMIINNRNDNE